MTFCSVFEITDVFTTSRKAHVWCWFSGDTLHPRWTTSCVVGCCSTFAMNDVICGGFGITPGSAVNDIGAISFNNTADHYDDCGAHMIAVNKVCTNTLVDMKAGFSQDADIRTNSHALIQSLSSQSVLRFDTRPCGGTSTNTNMTTGQAQQSYRVWCIILNACDATGGVAGCVEATNSTNLPCQQMQPNFQLETDSAAAKLMSIVYMEAFNT